LGRVWSESLKNLITPCRVLKQEGKIHLSKLDMGMGRKDYDSGWYFLFNDGLLITEKKKDEKYVFKYFVDFQGEDSIKIKDVDTQAVQNAFQILTPSLTLFLSCIAPEEKVAITEHIKNYRNQKHIKSPSGNISSSAITADCVPPKAMKKLGDVFVDKGVDLTVTIFNTETFKEGKKEYTVYHVQIRNDATNKKTDITKRYSDFDHLYKKLKKQFGSSEEIPELPKKHIIGSMSKDTVESRRVMLELFLQNCVQKDLIRNSDVFIHFLRSEFNGRKET